MKRRSTLALIAVLAAAAARAQTVDEIVARHVAARGGREALSAVRTLRMTGRAFAGPGREAIVRREIARPGRIRTEFVFQGTTGVYVWDGSAGWRVSPLDGGFEPEPLSEEAAALSAEQADIEGPLVDWRAKGHRVELVGSASLPGGAAHELKVTLKSGVVRHVWVDAATGQIVKASSTRKVRGHELDVRDRLRRLPRDGRRPLRALDRDRRPGPAAADADRGRERGGEPDARRFPIPDAALKRDSSRRRYFFAKQYRVLGVRM